MRKYNGFRYLKAFVLLTILGIASQSFATDGVSPACRGPLKTILEGVNTEKANIQATIQESVHGAPVKDWNKFDSLVFLKRFELVKYPSDRLPTFFEKWGIESFYEYFNSLYTDVLPPEFFTDEPYAANKKHNYSSDRLKDALDLALQAGMKEESERILKLMLAFDKTSDLTRILSEHGRTDMLLMSGIHETARYFYGPASRFNNRHLFVALEMLSLTQNQSVVVDLSRELTKASFQDILKKNFETAEIKATMELLLKTLISFPEQSQDSLLAIRYLTDFILTQSYKIDTGLLRKALILTDRKAKLLEAAESLNHSKNFYEAAKFYVAGGKLEKGSQTLVEAIADINKSSFPYKEGAKKALYTDIFSLALKNGQADKFGSLLLNSIDPVEAPLIQQIIKSL